MGVELDPAHQVIKKLKMDPNAVSHFMPQKKTKRACQSLKFWIHVLDREINIFKKFHVKIKFWSKVIEHEIRGTNFWDTLYGGVYSHNYNKLNNLRRFRRQYQESLKIAEYPLYQLIRLHLLDIHNALSNPNIDVRILARVISLSSLWTWQWTS